MWIDTHIMHGRITSLKAMGLSLWFEWTHTLMKNHCVLSRKLILKSKEHCPSTHWRNSLRSCPRLMGIHENSNYSNMSGDCEINIFSVIEYWDDFPSASNRCIICLSKLFYYSSLWFRWGHWCSFEYVISLNKSTTFVFSDNFAIVQVVSLISCFIYKVTLHSLYYWNPCI